MGHRGRWRAPPRTSAVVVLAVALGACTGAAPQGAPTGPSVVPQSPISTPIPSEQDRGALVSDAHIATLDRTIGDRTGWGSIAQLGLPGSLAEVDVVDLVPSMPVRDGDTVRDVPGVRLRVVEVVAPGDSATVPTAGDVVRARTSERVQLRARQRYLVHLDHLPVYSEPWGVSLALTPTGGPVPGHDDPGTRYWLSGLDGTAADARRRLTTLDRHFRSDDDACDLADGDGVVASLAEEQFGCDPAAAATSED